MEMCASKIVRKSHEISMNTKVTVAYTTYNLGNVKIYKSLLPIHIPMESLENSLQERVIQIYT